jgi:hypothetical protein
MITRLETISDPVGPLKGEMMDLEVHYVNGHSEKRILGLILMICLLVYIISAKGYIEVSDTAYSVQTAQAIVTHRQLNIADEQGRTLQGPDGRSYSKYGIGLPLYFVPWVAAAGALSHAVRLPTPELTGALISFANIPFAMLTLLLFSKLLKWFGVSGVYAWLFPLALGLGTLAWKYADYDFSEEMQMALLLLAVYGVIRGSSKSILGGGLGFGGLILVKLVYTIFFPLFLLYLVTRPGELRYRIRHAALFSFPFILASCFIAWMNLLRFGNPLESGYGSEAHQFIPSQMWHTVPQLLGSYDKGIFIFCPILILGLFGWKEFASRYRPEALLCAGLILGNLILTGAWHGWDGGWAWGPRLLVPMIPFWLLPAAFWCSQRQSRTRLWIFSLLLLASIVLQVPGILVKNQEIREIKDNMLTASEQPFAPSDYVTACILLRHKLAVGNEVYRLSELHIPGNRELDLARYRTMIGLNVCSEQFARQMNKPALRWFPLLPLLLIGYLTIKIRATMKTAV